MSKKIKLNISVNEAQEKINLQLTRGLTISKFTIRSIKDLETSESRRHEWYDYTKALLESMDDNNELVNDFHYLTPAVAVSGQQTLDERTHSFRYHMKRDQENLQSIYNKLPLLQTKKTVKKKKSKRNSQIMMDAHFFFVDIIGLSNWLTSSTEEQVAKIHALNSLIKSCDTFKSAKGNKKFVLPTGDGMVIGFSTNHFAPLDLAIEIHKKLFQYNKNKKISNKVKIRIGIHSAPVLKFIDILNNENVWGEGIIIARRVMDLGDADHILLSSKMAEELYQISMKYRKMLHKVGKGKIKHGFGLEVYSAYGDGFGNKKAPKLDKAKLTEYKESDTRKLKREIELLKAQKKELENQKRHEIALYNENITDGGPFSLAITALNSGISKIDVQIKQKTLELTTL